MIYKLKNNLISDKDNKYHHIIKNLPKFKKIYEIFIEIIDEKLFVKIKIDMDFLEGFYKKYNYVPEINILKKILNKNKNKLLDNVNIMDYLKIQSIFELNLNFPIINNIKWMCEIEKSINKKSINIKNKWRKWYNNYKGAFIINDQEENIMIMALVISEINSQNSYNIIITNNDKKWLKQIRKIKKRKNNYIVTDSKENTKFYLETFNIKRIIFDIDTDENTIKNFDDIDVIKWFCLLNSNKINKLSKYALRNKRNFTNIFFQYFIVKKSSLQNMSYKMKSLTRNIKKYDVSCNFFKNKIYSNDKLIYLDNICSLYRLRFVYWKKYNKLKNNYFMENIKNKNSNCSICFEISKKKLIFNCGHTFCLICVLKILKFMKKLPTCPVCRRKIINIYPVDKNIKINSLLSEIIRITMFNDTKFIIISNYNFLINYFRNIKIFKKDYFISIDDLVFNKYNIDKIKNINILIFLEPYLKFRNKILNNKNIENRLYHLNPNLKIIYYNIFENFK